MPSVIVVDDDFDTVDVFSEYLRLKGIRVLGEAYNGMQAVKLYKELDPDVVLLDVLMPEYDGYYALREILEFDPSAKIILVTGSVTPQEVEFLEKKAFAVVLKPFDIDDVVRIINNAAKPQIISSPKHR